MQKTNKTRLSKWEKNKNCIIKRDDEKYVSFENHSLEYSEVMKHECFMAYIFASECELRYNADYDVIRENILNNGVYDWIIKTGDTIKQTRIATVLSYNPVYPFLNQYFAYNNSYDDSIEPDALFLKYAELPVFEFGTIAGIQPKSALVKIDFSKPIEEIEAIVKNIKKEFDKNPSIIENMHDNLNVQKSVIPFTDTAIYKKDKRKPLEGRLADVLFIYDCKKLGVTNDDIQVEIDRYWGEVKPIKGKFTDKSISKNTVPSYFKFAQSYIEQKLFLNYL